MDSIKDTYLTIETKSEGFYKEKGSKFIGLAIPVTSESAIKEVMKTIKAEYHDGRHHCYGFRVGSDYKTYRYSDDGEPSGSAGKPIYGQIQSYELTNILIVVIRYFGGTKLGVGGLINAYREAAKAAIEANVIVEKQITCIYAVHFAYSRMNELMRVVKEYQLDLVEQDFREECLLKFSVRLGQEEAVISKLKGLQFDPEKMG